METEVWGLAGKYCAGKNRAGRFLEEEGCILVDADRLGHQVLEENRQELVRRFGPSALDEQGRVDRRALGALAFRDPAMLKELESLVHPPVIARIGEVIRENPGRIVVINAALLFSSRLHLRCSRVLWVTAPLAVRFFRGLRRDRMSPVKVFRRIWVQRKLSPQPWRKDVDIYTIPNPGNEEILRRGIRNFLERVK